METVKYSDIESVTENGITFINHSPIIFSECIQNDQGLPCIAERNICGSPAYFEFYTPDASIRIIFCKTGLFSASRNRKDFHHLQKIILSYGYMTYDLS